MGRLDEAGGDRQQCGLPRAVRPHERNQLTGKDLQVEPRERDQIVVLLSQACRCEHGLIGSAATGPLLHDLTGTAAEILCSSHAITAAQINNTTNSHPTAAPAAAATVARSCPREEHRVRSRR